MAHTSQEAAIYRMVTDLQQYFGISSSAYGAYFNEQGFGSFVIEMDRKYTTLEMKMRIQAMGALITEVIREKKLSYEITTPENRTFYKILYTNADNPGQRFLPPEICLVMERALQLAAERYLNPPIGGMYPTPRPKPAVDGAQMAANTPGGVVAQQPPASNAGAATIQRIQQQQQHPQSKHLG